MASKQQLTMDKYRLVRKKASKAVDDDVMRISAKSNVSKCITRTISWLTREKQDTIKLTATGNAIWKAVTIVEIVKHRVEGLHQVNQITTLPTTDEYKPLEEGLDVVKIQRNLACLQILLTTVEPEEKCPVGYQEPLPKEDIVERPKFNYGRRRFNGRRNFSYGRRNGNFQSNRRGGNFQSNNRRRSQPYRRNNNRRSRRNSEPDSDSNGQKPQRSQRPQRQSRQRRSRRSQQNRGGQGRDSGSQTPPRRSNNRYSRRSQRFRN